LRRNCFLKHFVEGKIKGRSDGKTRKRTQQLLDDLKKLGRN
jgi:DNA-directed RNA polymerase beta subunit